ncbi:Sir2 histone deacetylase Hst2 [Talaromyces marneffei ATCC 18224]|uniref:NAD-dependent protein deacetylase n=2 Tax=Talaromyces marneffei TaxID=37727 RepID=B6Q3A7_TALMQ|nr:uncharacterized protein EYB26_001346 [Talaromyces marneffei]EEA28071.1 SIR2 family histone deacetylase, putative [Talaromyces marneffei ATCC 18224]KAE8556285.1 hypothetical protein EYB25_000986 [Talaromyces marneffei]QGA13696.1 hypothetical protein EYB26_001346 [Talaromyces marneffei]
MGNEASTPIDDSVSPTTLKSRTLESVAEYILKKDVRKIVVMTGAGISTSAGIPDFRSPETGLYSNLAHLELPDPEAVFNITFFRENPVPFYTLAKELYPGRYRPTIAHSFITLLHRKGRLLKNFTQNIDCLEREAGLPGEMIIDAHGSFASQHCIDCKSHYPDDLMKEVVTKGEVPHCQTPECNGLVKPDIVFFGEALPGAFFDNRDLPAQADLCIVMGTSLTVQPFAGLPSFCRDETPRLLINMEQVGGLGSRADDVLLLGDCDEGVRKLAKALGWLEELEALWEETNPNKEDRDLETAPKKTRDERLHDEVERLTADVDRTLHISNAHQNHTRNYLEKHLAKQLDEQVVGDKSDAPGEQILRSSNELSGRGGLTHVFPHLVDKKSTL